MDIRDIITLIIAIGGWLMAALVAWLNYRSKSDEIFLIPELAVWKDTEAKYRYLSDGGILEQQTFQALERVSVE